MRSSSTCCGSDGNSKWVHLGVGAYSVCFAGLGRDDRDNIEWGRHGDVILCNLVLMRKCGAGTKIGLRIENKDSSISAEKEKQACCGCYRPFNVLRSFYVEPKDAEAHLSVAAATPKLIIGLYHPILATTINHIVASLSDNL